MSSRRLAYRVQRSHTQILGPKYRHMNTTNIRNVLYLLMFTSDFRRCHDLFFMPKAPRSTSGLTSRQRRSLSPHVATNEHGDSRSQETELVSTLDRCITLHAFLLNKDSSLYLDSAALHLNLHPYLSFWLTYRYHTARRPKSRVYAKLGCRKCGERITEDRRSYLDTRTTPVGR